MKDTGERLLVDEKHLNTNYFRHIIAYEFAEKFIKDKIVLDDGCGSGYGAYHLKSRGAKRVIGVDISKEAIEYSRQKYKAKDLQFESMDVTGLNFDDNTFDTLTSFQVMEHIRDVNKYLAEMKRVLRNGGTAIISTPNKNTYSPDTIESENPFHIKEFYLNELQEILSNYFHKVQILGVSQSKKAANVESSIKKVWNFFKKFHLLFFIHIIPKPIKDMLINPFYKKIDVSDFMITEIDTNRTLDFIAICTVDK